MRKYIAEVKALGLQDEPITLSTYAHAARHDLPLGDRVKDAVEHGTRIVKKKGGGYTLNVNMGHIETEDDFLKAVRHELYHLASGDSDRKTFSALGYLLVQEPAAELYSRFRLDMRRRAREERKHALPSAPVLIAAAIAIGFSLVSVFAQHQTGHATSATANSAFLPAFLIISALYFWLQRPSDKL